MAAFNPNVWYVLSNSMDNANNTLSAGMNDSFAFDPNNPASVYYQPLLNPVPLYQQWQILSVSTEPAAYIMRNRQLGPTAQLTTGLTTRKCEEGVCATVPVFSSNVTAESLWNAGRWTYGSNVEGGFLFNLGNGTSWLLGSMDGQSQPQMASSSSESHTWGPWTGGAGSGGGPPWLSLMASATSLEAARTWSFSAHETIAPSDSAAYASVPSAVTPILAQYTDPAAFNTIVPYTPSGTLGSTTSSPTSTGRGQGALESGAVTSGSKSSAGTSIGIGVGIGVGFLLMALVFAFFFLHYRRKRMHQFGTSSNPAELGASGKRALLTSMSSNADLYAEMGSDDMEKGPHTGQSTRVVSELSHPSEGGRAEMAAPHYAEMGSDGTNTSYQPSELHSASTAVEMPHPSYSTDDDSTPKKDGV